MTNKLLFVACSSVLAMLACAPAGHAGEFGFSFGYSSHPGFSFNFGYSSYPAYGYHGAWMAPRAYVYRPYVPGYYYPAPVVRPYPYVPYAYVPYRHRAAVAYVPYRPYKAHGKAYGHYKPRRYGRYY